MLRYSDPRSKFEVLENFLAEFGKHAVYFFLSKEKRHEMYREQYRVSLLYSDYRTSPTHEELINSLMANACVIKIIEFSDYAWKNFKGELAYREVTLSRVRDWDRDAERKVVPKGSKTDLILKILEGWTKKKIGDGEYYYLPPRRAFDAFNKLYPKSLKEDFPEIPFELLYPVPLSIDYLRCGWVDEFKEDRRFPRGWWRR